MKAKVIPQDVVNSKTVFCNGVNQNQDDPALGHPGIYLKIEHSFIECTYCGKRFVLKKSQNVNES
jgi:uncharacterized Zn-finger protein